MWMSPEPLRRSSSGPPPPALPRTSLRPCTPCTVICRSTVTRPEISVSVKRETGACGKMNLDVARARVQPPFAGGHAFGNDIATAGASTQSSLQAVNLDRARAGIRPKTPCEVGAANRPASGAGVHGSPDRYHVDVPRPGVSLDVVTDVRDGDVARTRVSVHRTNQATNALFTGPGVGAQTRRDRHNQLVADAHVARQRLVPDPADADHVAVLLDGRVCFETAHFLFAAQTPTARRPDNASYVDCRLVSGAHLNTAGPGLDVKFHRPVHLQSALERALGGGSAYRRRKRHSTDHQRNGTPTPAESLRALMSRFSSF